MTHIELIEFIYKNRFELDSLYKKRVDRVSKDLASSRLVAKVGESVEVSSAYKNFVDITLKRIDYGIIFHTYSSELQDLLKYKIRYIEEKKPHYIDDIISLIKNIFFKLQRRDEEIRLLLVKLENENSLDLDMLLEKSMDILEKITEVNRANNEIREIFYSDTYSLDDSIGLFIDEINPQMISFISNISNALDRLNQFIARTRKLRVQNKTLFQLANNILEEKDEKLEEFLTLEPKLYYMTLKRSSRNKIHALPDGSEFSKVVRKLRLIIDDFSIKAPNTKIVIDPPDDQKLSLVNLQKIEDDLLSNGSEDMFDFIYNHNELTTLIAQNEEKESIKDESFKIFLQFIIPNNKNIELTNRYNEHNIRIAKWINL